MVRTFPARGRAGIALAALCWGCSQSQPIEPMDHVCPHGPIVFVHGLGQDSRIFDSLIASLVRRGMNRECLRAVDYSDGNLPNRLAAEQELAPFVERVLADLDRRVPSGKEPGHTMKVNLIGHSMGALSSRWYAAHVRPDRVRVWLSTSGANHGTNWQCARSPAGGHAEMCPAFARNAAESAVQFALNGGPGPDIDETPYGYGKDSSGVSSLAATDARSILYVTVQTVDDQYILPQASLALDGAGGVDLPTSRRSDLRQISPGNFLLTTPSGHDELLASDALSELVFQAVTADQPVTGTN